MPIDWENVNWVYVVVLSVFVFISTLFGSLISFRRHVLASVLSAVVFAAIFVFWTYYPHHLPLPTSVNPPPPTAAAAPAAPAAPSAPPAPAKPANPVTDITPIKPPNPVTDITPKANPQ